MHLRLVKLESLLDKQGKMSFRQLDMSQKIKGAFGAGYIHIGTISILIMIQSKGLYS